MKKKKVLHLLPSGGYSGAENVVCTIIDNDSEYDMLYCSPNGKINEILKERNIKHIDIGKLTPRNVKRVCDENDIDILHAHDYKASFVAALSGFKGEIISQLHVNWDFNSKWNIYTITYNILIKKFHKIIAVSKEILDEAVYVKKHKDKFVLITNVVDKNRTLEKSKEFKTSKYDLIYVGRLEVVKRPEIIIDVTNKLKKDIKNIKVCIIGTGSLEENLKLKIKEENLENNIDMLGFKKNPFPYIKNSKVAILPSLHEGLPMSVIECMILDVPVINSGVDGLKTLFKNNKEFICNDIEEYVETIKKELKTKLLSKKCNEIIKKETDMDSYIKKINSVYKN